MRGTQLTTAGFEVEEGGHEPTNAGDLYKLGLALRREPTRKRRFYAYHCKELNSAKTLNEQGNGITPTVSKKECSLPENYILVQWKALSDF